MPSAVCLPYTASPLDVISIVCETQQLPVFPDVVDNALNPTKILNYHDVTASASTASDIASVALRTVSLVDVFY